MDKDKKQHTVEQKLFLAGIAAVPFAYLLVKIAGELMERLWPIDGCVWDVFFGIYCPGCGGTRAWKALLKGDIAASFLYHPFVLYGTVIYTVFMVSNGISMITHGRFPGMKYHNSYLYAAVILIVVNCLIRNVLRILFGITI